MGHNMKKTEIVFPTQFLVYNFCCIVFNAKGDKGSNLYVFHWSVQISSIAWVVFFCMVFISFFCLQDFGVLKVIIAHFKCWVLCFFPPFLILLLCRQWEKNELMIYNLFNMQVEVLQYAIIGV